MVLTLEDKIKEMSEEMEVSWEEIDRFLDSESDYSGADTFRTVAPNWAASKYRLFKMFGNRLKIKRPVENTISNSETEKILSRSFFEEIEGKVEKKTYLAIQVFMGQMSYNEILNNTILTTKAIFKKRIQPGAKISRSFKQFVPKGELDEVQTAFSMLNQEIMAKGYLELSIDPLDIMTSSVNTDGRWRSCHHIINGEYGSGALSYAQDSSTAVAHIYNSKDDYGIPLKTWRQLVYFSTDGSLAILGRQYPGANKNNAKSLAALIKEEFYEGARVGFMDSDALEDVIENEGYLHYNDITSGMIDKARVVTLSDKFDGMYGSDEDNKTETMREFQRELRSLAVEFFVGLDGVSSVDCTETFLLSDFDGAIYSEACDDGYY